MQLFHHEVYFYDDYNVQLVVKLCWFKWQYHQQLNNTVSVKEEFIVELLYWITWDCIGVPNKMTTDCIKPLKLAAKTWQHFNA